MPPLFNATARRASLIALWLAALAVGPLAGAAPPPADLDLNGARLIAACRPDAWPATRAAIDRAASGRDASRLGALLHAYLCEQGEAAAAQVLRHAPRRIADASEGTGQSPVRQRVDAADALVPRRGEVWGLDITRRADARVVVQWHANEACVNSVTLVHRGGGWRFAETGSACD